MIMREMTLSNIMRLTAKEVKDFKLSMKYLRSRKEDNTHTLVIRARILKRR